MPNPWDPGSARLLEQLGFQALATTSSGFAWSQGRSDNHVSVDEAVDHFSRMAAAVAIPINGDFEGGFAHDADGVHRNLARASRTGVAGLSSEDYTGDRADPLYEFSLAVARVLVRRGG